MFKKLFLLCIIVLMVVLGVLHTAKKSNVSIAKKTQSLSAITDKSFLSDVSFSAWAPWWDEVRSIESLKKSKNKIEIISPVWYKLNDKELIIESNSKHKKEILEASLGKKIMPSVNNETDTDFDANAVSAFLKNKSAQEREVAKLIAIAKENNFIGWDIDWEHLNIEDRDHLTKFVKYFAAQLHKNNLQLSMTVQAQSSLTEKNDPAKAQDWVELSKSADFVRIMAYDFHYSGSEPGPVTPIDDLESVLDYAVKTISTEKIVLGVPTYGYDWVGNKGEPVQYEDAIDRIKKHNGSYKRDPKSDTLVGEYKEGLDKHILWFEDKQSVLRKLSIGYNYDVKKFAFWRLGGEDPEIWNLK